ncbi:T9SS type A sorting domain-containing protein [Flavobacterium ponti]|uniref:T9SS type A sorting domain-containing protein n=1 Tax=Flavobacterium ponti TaxID=665133 RepID=A0ABV9P0W4_9FLAO
MKKLYFLLVLAFSFTTQAQIVNIPDANFKAKLLSAGPSNYFASSETPLYDAINGDWYVSNYNTIDINNDGEIQVSEALAIKWLRLDNSSISNMAGIEAFLNLQYLSCANNQITNFNPSLLTNLQYLNYYNNQVPILNFSGLTNLEFLNCGANQLINLNISALTNLKSLSCAYNMLTNLNVTANSNLDYIDVSNNQLTNINVTANTNLVYLNVSNNQLTNLNVTANTNLSSLDINNNQLTNLNSNQNTVLKTLICDENLITNLNLLQNVELKNLSCSNNFLTSLNINQNILLEYLSCSNNQLSSLDLNQNTLLRQLSCSNNQISILDLNNTRVSNLYCDNNNLNSLFLKNDYYFDIIYGPVGGITLSFSMNNNLKYICADDFEIFAIQQKINQYGYINCHVNTYCTFVPGGIFYEIDGNTKYDYNSNGCDISDINYPYLNFSITDGTNIGNIIPDISGNYAIPVQAGSHTITPVIENPTYFNISPTSFVANFPTQTSPLNQDFCVTANGVHHDVEVTIIPTNQARPGFDANYTIIYKNKGNQIENGAVTLDFNDAVLYLVSANPTTNNQQSTTLTWNYTNLLPLEIRTIDVVFNVNSPTETPAVNIGDFLNYSSSITPLTTDEFVFDNTSTLNQTVVGSYDPNDKTCVEGTTVGPDMIGQYVHYVIRFENTGTYPAENIVVKDMIDLTKFDVNTLIPLHSSHDFVTRINGNKVEFIFEGINLPFDNANNDGYVAFKIKTKSNLVVGDTFSNDANIYFDYNFPITTNTFTTTIAALKVTDFDFGTHFTLYPNPVKDVLSFQSKGNVTINSIEIYNTLGQIVLAVPNAISTVDVSNLQSGNYFVKVNTNFGVSNTKFIKE